MRLPRPRFRLRTLLVLVALVALGLGGELMRRRRVRYLQAAAEHAQGEADTLKAIAQSNSMVAELARSEEERKDYSKEIELFGRAAAYGRLWATYYAEMRRRFEDAAAHPWRGDPKAIPEPPPPPADLLEEASN